MVILVVIFSFLSIVAIGLLVLLIYKMKKPAWRDLPVGEYRIVRVSHQEKKALLTGECLSQEGLWVRFSEGVERLEVGKIIQIYRNDFGKCFTVAES
jgi:hypothetical protein